MNNYNPYKKQKYPIVSLTFLALFLVVGFFVYDNNVIKVQAVDNVIAQVAPEDKVPLDKNQIALLDRIEALKLDGSIFKNKVFTSLQDFSVDIPPQEAGRDNPFAPIAGAPLEKVPKTPAKK